LGGVLLLGKATNGKCKAYVSSSKEGSCQDCALWCGGQAGVIFINNPGIARSEDELPMYCCGIGIKSGFADISAIPR